MIVFNELRITNTAEKLIIDVSVEDFGNEDQSIDQIFIDAVPPIYIGDSCPRMTDSAILIASFLDITKETLPITLTQEGAKSCRLVILQSDVPTISFASDMIQVYVVTTGTPSDACNCNPVTSAVANLYPIYRASLDYMKHLSDKCNPQRELIDLILRLKSIDLAIKSGNYVLAHSLWHKFPRQKVTINSCGCNG